MSSYEEVLNLVQRLTPAEQTRLLEALRILVHLPVEVEDDDEIIPPEEIAESEAAWQDYLGGRDRLVEKIDALAIPVGTITLCIYWS